MLCPQYNPATGLRLHLRDKLNCVADRGPSVCHERWAGGQSRDMGSRSVVSCSGDAWVAWPELGETLMSMVKKSGMTNSIELVSSWSSGMLVSSNASLRTTA